MDIKKIKKNKKIAIVCMAIIVAIIVIGVIFFAVNKSASKTSGATANKLENLCENLKQSQSYSFTATLDDKNKMTYEKNDGKAYTDTTYNGTESKFIIKDGNSYLLVDDQKAYYTYVNNSIDLNKIELQLSEVINSGEHQNGEEKIDGKNYQYEEYNGITDFTMQDTSNVTANQNAKTRFYFKNNKLVYIKTIINDKQELLKVDISNNVDTNLFEIPSDYEER
mgnify:FL=1